MVFQVTVENLINMIFIAAGIGICWLNILEMFSSRHLDKTTRRYFIFFFLTLFFYISSHLARQLMEGISGEGIRIALYNVTFFELLMSGFMAFMLSMLVVSAARITTNVKRYQFVILGVFILFIALLIVAQIFNLYFYFDDANIYHRAKWYILSNLCPVMLLGFNAFILIKYGKGMNKRIKKALWLYLIAPVIAVGIQAFSYGIQFIILATVTAGTYMFSTVVRELNEKYEMQTIENSRIETELSTASSIQANMLPNIFPAFPEREEFTIHASMNPAKEIGGDFYDFFLVDKDHLALVMADVSGKGVPAALFMMISKTLIQNYTMMKHSPRFMLELVNRQICANNREEMFVTVWVGILDLNTGVMTCGNAGHEFPIIKKPDGHFEAYKDHHNFVVGGMDNVKFDDYTLKLEPGSKLFLYTDGVPEATNASNEMFGLDRTVEALRTAEDETPEEILKAVDASVDKFVGDAPQFDDLTMLCLHYKGPV